MKIGVLASHEGTTLQAVLDACKVGQIAAQVAVVISNNSASGALRRAGAAGARAVHLSGATHPQAVELDEAIAALLEQEGVDVLLLAGYMKKLGPRTLEAFAGRVVNIHPSLLPKHGGRGMYGSRVHQAVIAARDSVSGCSVHLVDGEYDTGAVLAQAEVKVATSDTADTLCARVQAQERPLLIDVLARIARGDIKL